MSRKCLWKCDCAAEADVKAKVEEAMHFLRSSSPAMHHTSRAAAFRSSSAELLQHRLCSIPTVNNHGKIQLNSQVKLGAEHCELLLQIFVAEQIEPKLANGDNPRVVFCSLTQHINSVFTPMLRIERMHSDGVAHLWKAICQGTNGRNLRWLHAGMQ